MKRKFAALGAATALMAAGIFTTATAASAKSYVIGGDPEHPIVVESLDDLPDGAVPTGTYMRQCETVSTFTLTEPGDELVEHDEYRYLREVPAVDEVSHPEYRWKLYDREYDPGQEETFTWGIEERTRVQTDHSHQQYTYVKQVQTRDWVKDYATEYRYQKQTQTSMRHGDGAWQVVSDWSWWEPASIKPWTSQDVEVLESGDHAEWREWHSTGFLQGHWDYYDRDYRYVKNGQTRQVEVGGHWGPWSAWSNYGPVAPVVTTTPQSSINGWAIDSVHFVGSSQSAQYRWTLGSQVTITDPPTFGDWTAWTLTSSNLPSAPVLPANTATHEYRIVGPTGHDDARPASFSPWTFAGYTDWQLTDTAPADPDGQDGEDNPLNLIKLGSMLSRTVIDQPYVAGYTEYYVEGGSPSLVEAEASWVLTSPGESWTQFDERTVVDQPATPDVVTYYEYANGVECSEVQVTHALACGSFEATVSHDTPWQYGIAVEFDGGLIGDSVVQVGPGSSTIPFTFDEDEFGGEISGRYYITDATEWDLVPSDLNYQATYPEVGDAFREFTVITDCEPNLVDPIAAPGINDPCGEEDDGFTGYVDGQTGDGWRAEITGSEQPGGQLLQLIRTDDTVWDAEAADEMYGDLPYYDGVSEDGKRISFFHVFTNEPCPVEVTPVRPTVTDEVKVCTADWTIKTTSGSITIPVTEGIEYLLDGKVVSGTIQVAPGTYTIEPRAVGDHVLSDEVVDMTVTVKAAANPVCEKPDRPTPNNVHSDVSQLNPPGSGNGYVYGVLGAIAAMITAAGAVVFGRRFTQRRGAQG